MNSIRFYTYVYKDVILDKLKKFKNIIISSLFAIIIIFVIYIVLFCINQHVI